MALTYSVSASVQTSIQFTASGASAAGLKPGFRTFSLTGALGTVIINGDAVELWGSNDGGVTYQPLRQGNNQPVQLNFGNPEVVISDCCDHYATRRVAVGAGSTLAAIGVNGEAAANPLVQAGTVTFVAGTATVTGKILTTSSVIVPAIVTQNGGGLTAFASIAVTAINVGAGSFVLTAKSDADATLNTSTPIVNYIIVG